MLGSFAGILQCGRFGNLLDKDVLRSKHRLFKTFRCLVYGSARKGTLVGAQSAGGDLYGRHLLQGSEVGHPSQPVSKGKAILKS